MALHTCIYHSLRFIYEVSGIRFPHPARVSRLCDDLHPFSHPSPLTLPALPLSSQLAHLAPRLPPEQQSDACPDYVADISETSFFGAARSFALETVWRCFFCLWEGASDPHTQVDVRETNYSLWQVAYEDLFAWWPWPCCNYFCV